MSAVESAMNELNRLIEQASAEELKSLKTAFDAIAVRCSDRIIAASDSTSNSTTTGDTPESNTRRQIEAYLKDAGDYARLLVETSQDMIIAVDLTLRIVEFNPAAERAFGYSRDEVIGKSVEMLYAEPDRAWQVRVRTFGTGYEGSVLNRRKDGEVFHSQLTSTPVKNDRGEVIGVMGISRDITLQVRMEEMLRDNISTLEKTNLDLKKARQAADEANLAKGEFLATISHEIRTPMTAILGFAESLLEPMLDNDEKLNAAKTIVRNGEHLMALLNELLDMSKIEAGKLDVESVACNPVGLIAEVESLVRPRAAHKGIELKVEYEGPIPAIIQTDPTRLRQVLHNLLNNAVKFTDVGQIRLITRFIPGDSPALQFDVIDSGFGITREQAANLFSPFSQGDRSTARRFGGTGLGLAISKRLASLLGGDLVIMERKAEGPAGAHFRLRVRTGPLDNVSLVEPPAACKPDTPSASPAPLAADALAGRRILLAEDGPDNQRLITFILRKAGADVTVVENGQQAVEAALIAQAGQRAFDVILMDMQMPILDGYGAARSLRVKGYQGQIIALTARAMTHDRQKCLDAGCDDYAVKPIDRLRLVQLISTRLDTYCRIQPYGA